MEGGSDEPPREAAAAAAASADGEAPEPKKRKIEKPKKADFRQRAHCNPLSDFVDRYPISPDHVDWSKHYAEFFAAHAGSARPAEPLPLMMNTQDCPVEYPVVPVAAAVNGREGPQVRYLDVGCGFGGLLLELAPKYPDKLMLGLEIREQVTNYVGQRIHAYRQGAEGAPSHDNVMVLRTNAMKFLPNYFRKGQLERMFLCFPDPHFKRKNHRRRIISEGLLSTYAFVMAPNGLLYHSTDVKDLHEWMDRCCREHPMFEPVPIEELSEDPCLQAVTSGTEESKRVKALGRFGHEVYVGVHRRIPGIPAAT